MENQYPDWKDSKGRLVFGSIECDPSRVVGSSSHSGDNQSPDTVCSGVELGSGVDGVELNGVLGDGSERKEEEGVAKVSDQESSVSECLVPPVAGEYSGEDLVTSSVLVNVSNGGIEKENEKSDFDFDNLDPFDFKSLSTEDAPAMKEYSSEADSILKGLEKDMNFSNIWSNQAALAYHPFGNHTPNVNANGFSTRPIDEMMSGLSVRDLISSSNMLAPSTLVSPSDQYPHSIHLNAQIGRYTPSTMSNMSLGHPSSSCNMITSSGFVNPSAGLVGGQVVSDQYTHNFHLNSQVNPYPPLAGLMSNVLALGAYTSLSDVLDDLKKNSKTWRYNEKNKIIMELALSTDGSQYLIHMMANGDRTNTATILAAIATELFTVIGSENGLKVFCGLLKFGDYTQKEVLLERIVSDSEGVILRAQNIHGAKALTELVNHLKWSGLVHKIPSILATEIMPMLYDRYASILIQHCIFVLKPKQCEHLYQAITECACYLALDPYRCTLLYNLIDIIKGIHRTRLLNKLADNSVLLATHPSGNYVLNRVLELNDTRICRKISYLLKGSYKALAMDKHGSHVVETCLQTEGIYFVMEEFLLMSPKELEELACHEFGNYVIKMALQTTQRYNLQVYHGELVKALQPGLARLEESPHGKIVHRILKDQTHRKNGRCKKQYFRRDAE